MPTYTRTTWVNDSSPDIDETNLNNIEAGIDALFKEFDTNTILKADVDNTPIKLTVAASTFLGRKAAGNIAAMTVAEAKTLLAVGIADISDIPGTIASILTDHDKAAHDALGLDAGSLSGTLAAARYSSTVVAAIAGLDPTFTTLTFDDINAIKRNIASSALAFVGGDTADEGGQITLFGPDYTGLEGVSRFDIGDYESGKTPDSYFLFRYLSNGSATEIFKVDKSGNIITVGEIQNVTNLGIGTATFGTNADHVIAILNGTIPASSPADAVQLYAEDAAGSSELKARDEAGNIATLTPHNFSLFTPDPSYYYPWDYYAKNPYLGKEIDVDMEGAIRAIEALSGKQFIYIRDLPPAECEDIKANQRLNEQIAEKQRIEKIVEAEIQKEIEIMMIDAFEDVNITEKVQAGTKTKYVLNEEQGEIKELEVPNFEEHETGKFKKQLKAGIRFDEESGKFYRSKTREEAIAGLEK